MILQRFAAVYHAGGVGAVLSAVMRRLRYPRARCFPLVRGLVREGIGFEVGGPSPIFAPGGMLPVYGCAARIDNCNFAGRTIWEGRIAEGQSFVFHRDKAPGRQYIAEGATLVGVPRESYDFLLSSHMLEHTANPLRALAAWKDVLKPGGTLLLVVPHRDGTFDHRRPVTSLEHLVADYQAGTGEEDLTHLPEVLDLHDASMDPGEHDIPFRERAQRNAELRSLHHHVFDTRLVLAAAEWAGFVPLALEPLPPYHVVALLCKPGGGALCTALSPATIGSVLRHSPFLSDRR